MKHFLAYFIPLFVAIDPIGLLPIFLSLTAPMTPARRREVTFEAVSFALLISVGFMIAGNAIFGFLSITQADFKIAGGAILLVYSVLDLLTATGKPAVDEHATVGMFPLAMPLITGPATLTTTLILADREPNGYAYTAGSLTLNFSILLFVLLGANRVSRLLGQNALRAFSKLVVILLAAIAVNLIRTGIIDAWNQAHLPH